MSSVRQLSLYKPTNWKIYFHRDLSSNVITFLPDDIFETLTALEELYVKRNRLLLWI